MSELGRRFGLNEGYLVELYARYRRDPASVGPEVRRFLEGRPQPEGRDRRDGLAVADLRHALALQSLVHSIRYDGHRTAEIDPLGMRPLDREGLRPEAHGLTEQDLEALPADWVESPVSDGAANAAELIQRLCARYCGTTGYEFHHVDDPERRSWLHWAVESGEFAGPLDNPTSARLLHRLAEVETFERFLHRNFPGSKWFSIEGNDMLVPLLDQLLWLAAHRPLKAVGVGMAHRGRLNVLTHLLDKPYDEVLGEFEGGSYTRESTVEDLQGGWMRDVKYHAGGSTVYDPPDLEGEQFEIDLRLYPNPSHLELVTPVVLGAVRARQEALHRDQAVVMPEDAAMPVLIHGDASFPGQGIVAEALNLAQLPGYSVGGTVHVIVNNQIGFTTGPSQLHSGLFASSPAHGFGMPVIHVNADDPPAVLAATRLAFAYRERFHADVLIDLVGYRRYGHNEADEPSFTQPQMYARVREHPPVRELWARRLEGEGVVSAGEAQEMVGEVWAKLQSALEAARGRQEKAKPATAYAPPRAPREPVPVAGPVSEDALRRLNDELHRLPEGFHPHPKLERPFRRRHAALDAEGKVDWAHAEALALATVLADGVPVRLTGQDTERGTFNQRHAVLHDVETGEAYTPLASLPSARAPFSIHNSPLSEAGVLGFEYGYSVEARRSLVLWEAQFGDFINNAQSIIDEFIASAESKWGQRSGLVLLLPHGYEGQGPNHSSARLERFLGLAAEGNMRVVYPTTAAQYFHLLRWQAAIVQEAPDPLVVMTPKSLLRHPLAASTAEDLTQATFQPVLHDVKRGQDSAHVRHQVFCTGKVFTDIAGHDRYGKSDIAVVRIEQLAPFPLDEAAQAIERYGKAAQVSWLQEEPQNMGAWSYVAPMLQELLGDKQIRYIGRPRRASPAEGSSLLHQGEQQRILDELFTTVGEPSPRR